MPWPVTEHPLSGVPETLFMVGVVRLKGAGFSYTTIR
jgi:hypothetical protein